MTSAWSGSALMRDPDHALSLVEAMVGAIALPVTLKMRLGWDAGSMNAPEIAARAEAAGVAPAHRPRADAYQFYRGRRRLGGVAAGASRGEHPGDRQWRHHRRGERGGALAISGADGVMIGRAAHGQPWLAGQVAARLAGVAAMPAPTGAFAGLGPQHPYAQAQGACDGRRISASQSADLRLRTSHRVRAGSADQLFD